MSAIMDLAVEIGGLNTSWSSDYIVTQ